jgi:broad specificity phosphatase PhoE
LHELDCGLWQGLRIGEIKKRYGRAYRQWRSDPTSVRPPQGESLEEAAQRVQKSLLNLNKKKPDKTIIVVAARMVAALIECVMTQTPLQKFWPFVEHQENIRIFEVAQPWDVSIPGAGSVPSRRDHVA